MPKFFVLSHSYNDQRSWWEPYFGERLIERDSLEAAIESLSYSGLYKVFEVSTAVTVQVEERKVLDRVVSPL